MELSRQKLVAIAIVVGFIAGCATTTGVLPKTDDVFTINVSRGDAGKVKKRAYQHAKKFCSATGKTMQVVNENIRLDKISNNSSVIDLDFRCVK